jgi:hypothetical protein
MLMLSHCIELDYEFNEASYSTAYREACSLSSEHKRDHERYQSSINTTFGRPNSI